MTIQRIARNLVFLTLIAAAPAHAEPARTTFTIQGIVPTICKIDFSQPIVVQSETSLDLGSFEQLCNDRSGYRVVLEHPANLDGATLDMDGLVVPLGSAGETVIIDSDQPEYRLGHARLDLAANAGAVTALYFRVEPKGMVF